MWRGKIISIIEKASKHWLTLLLTLVALFVGLYLSAVNILDLHFHPTYEAVFKRNEVASSKAPMGLPIEKSVINSGKSLDTLHPIIGVDTAYGKTIENSEAPAIKVFQYDLLASKGTSYLPSSGIQMNDIIPKDGYGILAIRSFCDFCRSPLNVQIYSNESEESYVDAGTVPPMYDPQHKEFSTRFWQLPAGRYRIELDYIFNGKSYMVANVRKGKVSLYNIKKTNTFGAGNGQIVITAGKLTSQWKVTVDDKPLGIVKFHPGRDLFLNVKKGGHYVTIAKVNPDPNSLTDDSKKFYVDLEEGQRIVKEVY